MIEMMTPVCRVKWGRALIIVCQLLPIILILRVKTMWCRYCSAGKIEVALKKRPKEDFSWSKTHIDYLVAISMLGPSVSQCECGRGEERVGQSGQCFAPPR